jgi:PKD repeat protein
MCEYQYVCRPGFTISPGGPYRGVVGQPIEFHANISLEDGDNLESVQWDFGDGTGATGETAVHSYDAPNQYVVRVRATTPRHDESATTTATVTDSDVSSSDHLHCEYCDHSELFQWNPFLGKLEVAARFWIERTTPENGEHHFREAIMRAGIYDPTGVKVFDSDMVGLNEQRDEVQVDFTFFSFTYATNPRPGWWRLELDYWYKQKEDTNARPLFLGYRILRVDVPLCMSEPCDFTPRGTVHRVPDGSALTIAMLNADPDRQYVWDWRLGGPLFEGPGIGNGPPDARFSSVFGPSVTLRPKWVALPNHSCPPFQDVLVGQALRNAQYDVWFAADGVRWDHTFSITSIVPWGFLPAYSFPTSGGGPAAAQYRFDGVQVTSVKVVPLGDRYTVDPDGTAIERDQGTIVYHPSLLLSQFFTKFFEHERDHRNFLHDETRCGARYYRVETFRGLLRACVASDDPWLGCVRDSPSQVMKQVLDLAKIFNWSENAAMSVEKANLLAEDEAHRLDSGIPPHFFQCHVDSGTVCPR